MNKFFIIIFFSIFIIKISAQTENNEKPIDEEVMYIDLDIDEDEVLNVPKSPSSSATKTRPSSASKNFLIEGNNKKLYKIDPLYKDFDWIRTKKERDVGVIKDGKIFLPLVFFAETNQKGSQIILSYKHQKGVYDLDLDKWIIPTISDWIVIINPDLFAIRMLDGFFRLVNSKNEILEKTNWGRFDKSSINSNHYIIKTKDNLFGLYDLKQQKIIFDPIHNNLKIQNGHYSISKNGVGKNLLNPDGTFIFDDWVEDIQKVIDPKTRKRPRYFGGLDTKFDYYIVKRNGKRGLVRSDSKVVIPFKYNDILYRGYFWCQNKTGKWGVINDDKIVIPFKYDEIFSLRNASTTTSTFYLLKVRIGNKLGLYQFNYNTLNLLAKCNYKEIRTEHRGVIVQYPDGKYQLINYDTKKPVFKTKKDAIIQSYQNSFLIKDRNNWSLVTSKGVNRINQGYKDLQNFHFYIIAKNYSGKFGILSNKGKIILPFEYQNIISLDEKNSSANIFVIKKGGKYGLFNAYEKQTKTEVIYDNIFKDSQYFYLFNGDDFFESRAYSIQIQKRENYVPIKKEVGLDKNLFIIEFTPRHESIFGLYDFKKNDWILPLGFKNIIKIKEDLFLIKKNNEPVTFVNSKGKLIRKTDWVQFDRAKQIKNEFNHFYIKNKKGLIGLYDAMSDKEIFPCIYDKISIDNDVPNHYFLKKGETNNYVNLEGKLMFPDDDILIVKKISTYSNLKYFTFKRNGQKGVIRSDGKVISSAG